MELNTDYDIEKAFRAIEDELISSMIRNLDGHRAEETELGYNWSQWQVEQLKALEKYKADNKKRFQSKFSDINGSIDAMIFTARQTGGTEQEQKILRAIKKGLKASKVSQGTEGAFFKLNTRKLDALIKATKADFAKAEHSMLRMSEDKYRQIIFNAQVYANTGAGTYEKAVDMATKDFLKAGINCIEYANGARHTMKDYAKMAIQTANKRAYLTGEGEMRQSWGISTVIMNKRANACPKCLPFVGKILIDDVWSGGKASDGPYPLMSSAMAAGLYHPNCKDIHTTYFPELDDEPDSKFSKKELEQVKEDYKQDQKQQYAGRMAEQFDRLSKYSLDPDNKKMYEVRKEQWEKQVNNLEIEKESSDKDNFIDYVKNPEEALKALTNKVGIRNVEVDGMDKQLLVDNTNQLIKLENKFGVINQSEFVDFNLDEGNYIGNATSNKLTPANQYLTLNKKRYSDRELHINNEIKGIKSGYSMPAELTNKEASVYTITHEYGHMLQNVIKRDYMKSLGWTESNAFAFINRKAKTNSAKYKWYEDVQKKIQNDCYDEIIAIAKRNNPSFDLEANISEYGKTSKNEFFAEVFANSQLSKPNELGNAMNQWLKEKGLVKETLEKGVQSSKIKLSNIEVRKRYVQAVADIKNNIDSSLPMEEKARKAFEARNRIRTQARDMMADEKTRKQLDTERPNKTFEELIQSKMNRKGMSREEAIQDIYKTATKTNENVNKELGLEGD
jgi:hypothetical protein